MPTFCFIHAADLHLGAPFKGLDAAASEAFAPVAGGGGNVLAEAGFEALNRLEDACVRNGAAFLILSGDIYDDRDGVLRARFALRDMFLRLRDAGVRVFLAHGNHDPLRPGPLPVSWPDNVTVFGSSVGCECVTRDGSPLALVQGISHAAERETENLALRFRRYEPGDADDAGIFAALPEGIPAGIFQVAVLHCAVGGAGEGHAPYAPCALSDLTGAGFDYWALGHVHQGKVLSEEPFVVYPGSLQGLHSNETGDHGCCLVRVDEAGCSVTRLPLAPVVWEKIGLDVGGMEDAGGVDALEERICAVLENAAGERDGAAALFCRVVLTGATDLDGALRGPGSVRTLLERVRKTLADSSGVRVWVKDILPATSPARDFAALRERDDLVGEVLRMADSMRDEPGSVDRLAGRALATLYANPKLKKALGETGGGEPSRAGNLAAADADLADEAALLLCSLLEGGGE